MRRAKRRSLEGTCVPPVLHGHILRDRVAYDFVPRGEDAHNGFKAQFRMRRDNVGGYVFVAQGVTHGRDFRNEAVFNLLGEKIALEPDLPKCFLPLCHSLII
jgi:hypothetical protein